MYSIHILIISAVVSGFCDAARILAVIPTPSISHQVVFRPLTRELAKRGHEVVVITTDPEFPKGETPENITEIDVHDISYKLWRDEVLTSAATSGKSNDLFIQMEIMMPLLSKIFEIQMMTDQVQQVINNSTNHFDLIIAEACVRPSVSLSHVFKAPIVRVSSLLGVNRNYDVMGAPMRPPLQYPTTFRQKIYNMSLWDKLIELYHHYLLEKIFHSQVEYDNKMVKMLFGPDTPTVPELENNVHLLLVNAHPIWDSNRPVPPSIVYMGGVHQNPSKELPEHPKVKLFITQGGLQSTDEAITAGVPLIGMPMLGDQWYNVEQYVHHKIGLRLDLESLTEEALLNGINTIVMDDSFRKNIVKLRSVMHDQPEKPLDRAVWWTEHVIRHGGAPHLRARVANMSWAEYLDVQLMATLALLLITAVAALSIALYIVVGLVRKHLSASVKLKNH